MTRKAPQDQRVDENLHAAAGVFVDKGYEGASMAAIASRAGLTKGGLYHHFRSKDEVPLAAIAMLSALDGALGNLLMVEEITLDRIGLDLDEVFVGSLLPGAGRS